MEVSQDCGGEWTLDVLEEIFVSLESIQTDTYESVTTILKDAFFYAYQSFYFCGWNTVFADMDAYCTDHAMECSPVTVINRLVNKHDQFQQFLDDMMARAQFPPILADLVENAHEVGFDLGSIGKIVLQFYV